MAVPRLHGATVGHEAIWYRVRFPRPRHRQRTLLRFDGAFLTANVWLNGRLLGSHYGYFAPFSFDISSYLLEENVLAVCVEAPVELDLASKRHVMGLFNDWDSKPYPSRELGRLPEQYVWHVPMGLWQPVYLEQVGHVVAEWLHCEPRVESGQSCRLSLRLEGERAVLEVDDDGSGFDAGTAAEAGGQGLRNLRDRVADLGGEMTIESRPGEGTTVRFELPA